jgi:membrane protease YdiL (CAAX protease family)
LLWPFFVWTGLALAALLPVTALLDGAAPIFTVIWLIVPLVAVARSRAPKRAGFRPVAARDLARYTAINLGVLLALMAVFEPWSGVYQLLVRSAVSASPPDTTFAWLVRFDGAAGWVGMLLYSGLVTLYAEELFFRGWLLQVLLRRMRPAWAIAIQAACFAVPQAIATLLMSPLQGVLYVVVYSWLAIGVVGGWAAARTGSIWPSLISATVCNFILTALILS